MLMPPVDSWSDRSSIFKDVEGVRPAIDAICEQEGIGYRRIETPHGSHTNAVFILDRSLVLKIYNPVWPEFEMECRLIEVLSRNGAVPAPSIVASGQLLDRLSWSYLIQDLALDSRSKLSGRRLPGRTYLGSLPRWVRSSGRFT